MTAEKLPASAHRTSTPAPTRQSYERASATLEALAGWTYASGNDLPETVTEAELSTAIGVLSWTLQPATPEALAVAIKVLADFGQTFGLPAPQIEAAIATYREDLADLPGDILLRAVKRVRAEWRWGNRLPMSGDIRKAAADDLAARGDKLRLLQAARLRCNRPAAVRPETKAEEDARLRSRRAAAGPVGDAVRSVATAWRSPEREEGAAR